MSAAPPLAKAAAMQAVPLLEAAVRDRPDDLRAGEALGFVLATLDRREEALRAYRSGPPHRPRPRVGPPCHRPRAVPTATARPARAALQRVIAVDPWRSDYRLALAEVCAQAGDWPGAVSACREALRLNPELFEARSLLVRCYLHSGEPEKADAEFRTLLRSTPPAARSGSIGTSSRSGRARETRAPRRMAVPEEARCVAAR